jgi:hypothetical protein
VDHGINNHDDLCNAAAGSLVLAASGGGGMNISDETLAYARSLRPWRNEFVY